MLSEIMHLDLNVAQYKPLKGFSYLPFEEGALFPVYLTKERFPLHVNLLLFSKGEKLNRLLSNQTKYEGQIYYRPYCLLLFVREQRLEGHKPLCSQHGPQIIQLPNDDNMFLQFQDSRNSYESPLSFMLILKV